MPTDSNYTHHKSSRQSILLDEKYWEFFVPTILMAMTLTMSIVVDSIIVGNMLGADALAAVNLVMPVIMVYNTVAVCFGLGAATLISIAKGRRQEDYANDIFTTTLFGMFLVSIIFLIGQEMFMDGITRLLTREPSLRPMVSSYLHILVYGTPLIITIPGLAYCLRVDARVKLASTVLIVSNLVNLGLDLVYMGPLKMGIAGSSLATVSGYIVGGVVLLSYAFSKDRTLRFHPGSLAQVGKVFRNIRQVLVTGTPAAMGSILITFKILCVNHIVLAVAGKSGMVAFSVCLSCLSFVSMFISGAAQAMTPIVGILYGETDYTGIKFVMRRAFKTLLLASFAATILLESFPGLILELFGVHHPGDIAEGIPAIRIFSISLIGTSISFLSMYYFMTIGRTRLSTGISFVQGFAVVPIALIMSRFMGSAGVWAAFSVAEVAAIAMVGVCYLYLRREYPTKYKSLLLLDQELLPRCSTLEMTTANNPGAIGETLKEIPAFMDALKMTPQMGETMESAVREAAVLVAEQAYPPGRTNYIDITLKVFSDKVVIGLRDSGTAMDLAPGNLLSRVLPEKFKVEHSHAIGFNTTTLTFQTG